MDLDTARTRVEAAEEGSDLVVRVGGVWELGRDRPRWEGAARKVAGRVRIVAEGLERWDSSLILFIERARAWCEARGIELDSTGLPGEVRELLSRFREAPQQAAGGERPSSIERLGLIVGTCRDRLSDAIAFVGSAFLALIDAAKHPRRFRFAECLVQMRHAGVASLPIVGVLSFLVGVIVAFQAAIQLRQFGAQIYVADIIGLSVVREMGPMMASVMLAGRIGAAYAAELGNMKVNEEVDALQTFGISPMRFLVLPRLVAMLLMSPLLAIYADALGILGGLTVSLSTLDLSAVAFWVEMKRAVTPTDVLVGLVKSVVFGVLVAITGCCRGLRCERSSADIGRAATAAVVTGIFLIVVVDALFGQVFNALGI